MAFGRTREHIKGVRRRYDFLFGLILNSGLRITEPLGIWVRDVRVADGFARSVRVIGKGNRERLVPLPKDFGPGVRLLTERPGEGRLRVREGAGRQGSRSPCRSGLPAAATRSRGNRQEGHPTSSGIPMRPGSSKPAPSS